MTCPWRTLFLGLVSYSTQPTDLSVTAIDAELVAGFLSCVELSRNNSIHTRNVRRSAIRGFFRFVAVHEPALLLHCQQVLVIPAKRQDKRTVDFLDPEKSAALIATPDLSTAIGRRDRTLLLVALQTGLRVLELIGLNVGDVILDLSYQAHVQYRGKGRNERATPLRSDTVMVLEEWLRERSGAPHERLFVSNRKQRFSQDGIERIVRPAAQSGEVTLLQTLGPDPVPAGIERQHLQHRAPTVHEHIPVPIGRVGAQLGAHQRRKPVEGTAHVARRPVQPNAAVASEVQHRDGRRKRRTIPSPRSSSASHTGDDTGESANSTNRAAPFTPLPSAERRSLRRHNENVLGASDSDAQNAPVVRPLRSNRDTIARHSFAERRTVTRFTPFIQSSSFVMKRRRKRQNQTRDNDGAICPLTNCRENSNASSLKFW